jgi:ferritin-like metal-binding protein YciE
MKTATWIAKMLGMSLTLDNLRTVLIQQLRDLSSAEEQLIEALPQLARAATHEDLRAAFYSHLEVTRAQKTRLDRGQRLLGEDPDTTWCEAMQALIAEAQQISELDGAPEVKDAALIAAAQRVAHYEIAGYGCARSFARQLGHMDVAELLQQSLDEESTTDKRLSEVAEAFINADAARAY